MEKSLVSVVTPCYNTGSYIGRLLESVLQQTYPNIEMFVIDDGSTDNSVDVVESYKQKFQDRGYSLTLVSQKNSGQSVAIREGMKLIRGKYFVWPDSDDYYATPDAIERMVEAFTQLGDEYGLVRLQANLLEEQSLKIIGKLGANVRDNYSKIQLFEDCLYSQNAFYVCSGAYMADFDKLKLTTTLDIYTDKNAGQNWQLMLPLLYNYKCATIQETLYNVVVRLSSHSRGKYDNFEKIMLKLESYELTIHETLNRIIGLPFSEKNIYSEEIRKKFCKERILRAFEYNNKDGFQKNYKIAQNLKCLGKKEKIMRLFFNFPIVVKGVFYIKRNFCK